MLQFPLCAGILIVMAEMVGSAVVEETLKQVMSGLIGKQQHQEDEAKPVGGGSSLPRFTGSLIRSFMRIK
jgi:hypothetical protein